MVFELNMVTLWVLAFVLFLACLKVLIKVVRILSGVDGATFDIRKLPEFLATDILPDLGGLFILSLPTFLAPAGLPEDFGKILFGLHALFYAAALALAGKYVAKIRDQFPTPAYEGGVAPPASAAPGPAEGPAAPADSETRRPPVQDEPAGP